MTRANKTRSALFTSIISLLLCVSMLVGTTFAWFTDVAETGLNQIVAGNLDVALLDGEGNSVEGDTELFTMPELWEPGAVAYAQIQVANIGTLDLKASLSINYEDVNSLNGHVLSEVLKYAVIDATNVDLTSREAVLAAAKASDNKGALNIYNFSLNLEAGEESKVQTLVIYWEPNADAIDNLYNANNGQTTSNGEPLQINLGVKVFATQLGGDGHEEDSFGPDYDLNAPVLVMIEGVRYETLAEAIADAKDGDTIQLTGAFRLPTDGSLANRELTFQANEGSTAIIDMKKVATGQSTSGASLTFKGVEMVFDNEANYKGIQHAEKVVYEGCTLYGKQFMYANTVEFTDCELINYKDYCVWTYGTDATFNGCTFTTGGKAILVYNEGVTDDVVTVTDCTFNSNGQAATDKAAVETGFNTADSKHTLVINNSTANGFAANKSDSPLWGNKNNRDADHLSVTINGVQQKIALYWDGKTETVSEIVEKTVTDAAGNETTIQVVEVNSPAELAGLSAAVNAGTTYEGVTVLLTTDMDLEGIAWTPIGINADNRFKGNLDGQGHTISNLSVEAESNRVGLIGCAGGTFSVTNLTINNASVEATGAVGAFVGWCDGAKVTFDNLTLTGDVKLHGANGGVGGILGQNPNGTVYASNIIVNVNEGSYVSTEGNERYHDYVGGVFGQIWGSAFENITSNIDVICGNSAGAGGISGGATGTWTNISCSGDVIVLKKDTEVKYTNPDTNKNEPGAVYWYQTCGTVIGYHGGVTYTNCTSTGTLTYADGSTSNDMTWIDSEGNVVEDSRFGASRWSTDDNVTIND